MKIAKSLAAMLLFLLLCINVVFSEDNVDLTGTWDGLIYLSGIDIDMEITLVLLEKAGRITGRITDDWGFLDCDITEPSVQKDIFTFKALVETSREEHQMAFELKIAGDTMTGQWESLGTFGEWSLSRRKEGEIENRTLLVKKDILGIWKGPAAYKSNPGSKNILTLKLEEREGELVGTLSDQFGTDYRQLNIKSFQDNRLSFEITYLFKNDRYIMDIDAAFKDASHMRGRFKIEKMDRTGIWSAEKQTIK